MWPLKKKDPTKGSFSYSETTRDSTTFLILGVEFIVTIVVIAIIFGVLNYFSIFPLSSISPKLFGWLPTNNRSTVPKHLTNPNITPFIAPKVTIFSCPVTSIYCGDGKSIKFNNNPALLYKTAEGSIVKTLSFYTLQSKPYNEGNLKGYSQTFIYNSFCYTASYLFPSDVRLEKIGEAPFGPNLPIATLGKQSYKNGENEGNVLIQLQKRKLAKPLEPRHETESCELLNLNKKDYGSYENLNTDYFNKEL